MSINDELGKRMKNYYEFIPKTRLMRRTPVIMRFDGKAFHTFTKNLQKPFDDVLINSMQSTMKYLCENIQGAVIGYTQSDEITIMIQDYAKLTTEAWFDYEVQKICSIGASMATLMFNKYFKYYAEIEQAFSNDKNYNQILENAIIQGAMFDARCFNIPEEEVTNLFYWRQLDAMRNSIQMVAQTYFPAKDLENKDQKALKEMLDLNYNIDWNTIAEHYQRGSCCIKKDSWIIDKHIPIFKGEGREYIESILKDIRKE